MQLDINEVSIERPVVFRINDNGTGPELLQQVFLERGWVEYDEEVHNPDEWNLWWRTSRFRTGEYTSLLPWQHINHFPSCTLITKKDALCRNIRKMRVVHGLHVYNFSPKAFNLPNDYTKFVSDYAATRHQAKKEGVPAMWICKPAESSRGRGIFIFSELSELQYDCNAVVQHYIENPLLIGGYKFDIRVYVAVPSFHPLEIYIHEEGLVRFSTEKYDLDHLSNVFAHLTNTSINKFSPGYTADKDEVGHGCKWTITQLRRYFLQNNIDDTRVWQQITNIIILTILMQAPTAPQMSNCFELYGFDILIDTSLKAWLLEVNFSPALSSDCHADILAKKSMLHDLMSLVQISTSEYDSLPYNMTGCRIPSKDMDTARTVASTVSRVSHASGKPFYRGNNNNGNRLSPNSSTYDSNRGRKVKHSHSSQSVDRTPRSSISFNGNNDKAVRSGSRCGAADDLQWLKAPNRNRSSQKERPASGKYETHKRPGSGRMAVMKFDSLPYLNGKSKEENLTEQENGFIDKTYPNLGANALSCENEDDTKPDVIGSNGKIKMVNGHSATLENDVFKTPPLNGHSPELGDTKNTMIDKDLLLSGDSSNTTLFNGHNIEDDDELCGGDGTNYEVKVVKGNMKGHGVKQVISPIPPISSRKEKQNKVATMAMARRHEKQSSTTDMGHPQRTRTYSYSSVSAYPDSNRNSNSNYRNSIPRNFSRLEYNRFPLPQHHARPNNKSPGKNGTAPLSRIPQKQVGRLFLVFPFNEATQKLSAGKLDAKLVIKEILRMDAKNKKADGESVPNPSGQGSIWGPLKNC